MSPAEKQVPIPALPVEQQQAIKKIADNAPQAQRPKMEGRLTQFARQGLDFTNMTPDRQKALETAVRSNRTPAVNKAIMSATIENDPGLAARWKIQQAQKQGYRFSQDQKDRILLPTKIIVDSPEKAIAAYKDSVSELRADIHRQDAAAASRPGAMANKPAEAKPGKVVDAQKEARIKETEQSQTMRKLWSAYAANKRMMTLQEAMTARDGVLMKEHFPNGFGKSDKQRGLDSERFEKIKDNDMEYQKMKERFNLADKTRTASLKLLDISPERVFLYHGQYAKHAVAALLAPAILSGLEHGDRATQQMAQEMGGVRRMEGVIRKDVTEFEHVSGRSGQSLSDVFVIGETREQWNNLYKRYFKS